MQKTYSRINWKNRPLTTTPLGESKLLPMDASIDEIDNRVVGLDTTKASHADVANTLTNVDLDEETGIFTFTRYNGSKFTLDTLLEKIIVNFDFDDDQTSAHYQQLIIYTKDGVVKYVDLSRFITEYEFTDTETISFTIAKDGKVSAQVKDGSIGESKLQPNYLADIKVESAKAVKAKEDAQTAKAASETAQGEAETAQSKAETAQSLAETAQGKAESAQGKAETAQSKAEIAQGKAQDAQTASEAARAKSEESAEESEAWAKGTRNGEAVTSTDEAYHNNAKYYSEQASDSARYASSSAQTADTRAQESLVSATRADNSAILAESYARGGTGKRDGEDSDNAKKYAEDAAAALENTVRSFNGRNGEVSPAKGDYSIGQISVDGQAGQVPTLNESGTLEMKDLPENGHTVVDESGKSLPFEGSLQFIGADVKDDSTNQKTVVTVSSTGTSYATCTTDAATAAKAATIDDASWTLKAGRTVSVKFSATNTAQNPTLNVNGTGAKPIYYGTAVLTTSNCNKAGTANQIHQYIYDGTNWVWQGHSADDNNTYTNMSQSEATTGTATTARAISAAVLKSAIQEHSSSPTAQRTSYDNATSGLSSTNVQGAVDELAVDYSSIAIHIKTYDYQNLYRRKNLGEAPADAQKEMVANGDFREFWNGDYWYDGTHYVSVLDNSEPYMRYGDTAFTKHHLVICTDDNIIHADGKTPLMNDTNTTAGGYAGTKYRSTHRATCKAYYTGLCGSAHIATYRDLFSNAVSSDGKASGWAWADADVELPTEAQWFGTIVWGESTYGGSGYNIGICHHQFRLLQMRPEFIIARTPSGSREHSWERDVVTASVFALADVRGFASHAAAAHPHIGFRPPALLI